MGLVRKFKYIPLIALALLLSTSVFAQDFHLSQNSSAPLFLNPAMAGKFDGQYRLHLHYRTQWNSIATKPFNTALASFDMPIKKFAVGAQISNNRAGAGLFNVLGIHVNGSYTLGLDKNSFHNISLGLQGGAIQKSVDFNRLYFANQYTAVNGGSFDQSLPTGETFGAPNFWLYDINAGFLYFYGQEDARINPFVGYSLFHITEPAETFYSTDNNLPRRHVIHRGFKFNLNERIQFVPKVMSMYQENDKELNLGAVAHYHLREANTILIFGPTFRSKDAAIIELGAKIGKYEARVSYDINTSSLNDYSDGKGGFEISLTYIPRKQKPNPIKNCPRI